MRSSVVRVLARPVSRALVSGTLAAAAVTLVASLAARRNAGSSAAALNATSHFLWGERAGRENGYSMKYTGLAANYGASIFWALFYELLGGRKRRTQPRALFDGALISAAAYVTDYHLVPKRLTPGFEMRLTRTALAGVYAALALGLSARDLIRPFSAKKPGPGKLPTRTMARYPWDPIEQAAADRSRGLEETDCRVLDESSLGHCPRPRNES